MKGQQFITSRRTTTLVMVLIALAFAVFTWQGMFSPGTLNAQSSQKQLGGVVTHADMSDQCGACHAPPWGKQTMADRCLDCHKDIVAELQNPHSLHSRVLSVGEPKTCKAGCHTEHNGPTASLTLIDEKHFGDQERGYSLQGHQKRDDGIAFVCSDCHQNGLNQFDLETCTNCHNKKDKLFMQAHVNTFGSSCLKCHDGIDTYGTDFNHQNFKFSLQGKHASLSCSGCHRGAQTITALMAAPRDCYSCHKQNDKHQGTFGTDCARCHTTDGWRQVIFNHVTAFPLTGKHIGTACTTCHVNNIFKGTPRRLLLMPQTD